MIEIRQLDKATAGDFEPVEPGPPEQSASLAPSAEMAPVRVPPVELAIVIPTFNERDNVAPLVDQLNATLAGLRWEAIFVDDDSPDGTADVVHALACRQANIRCLQRLGRRGL